jgi:hypothetical protein
MGHRDQVSKEKKKIRRYALTARKLVTLLMYVQSYRRTSQSRRAPRKKVTGASSRRVLVII